MILTYIMCGAVILAPLCIIYKDKKNKIDDVKDKEHLLKWLEHQIMLKEKHLNKLINEVTEYNQRPDINLSPMESRVLNAYEASNIRIPVDIIEDLKHARLQNEVDMYYFIENARLEWKTECAKKVMQHAKKGRS